MPLDFSKIGQPCELHELTGCSICSGLDKELQAEEEAEAVPERLAPGVVRALYPGQCALCRTPFAEGTAIRHSAAADGWVPVNGCVGCWRS